MFSGPWNSTRGQNSNLTLKKREHVYLKVSSWLDFPTSSKTTRPITVTWSGTDDKWTDWRRNEQMQKQKNIMPLLLAFKTYRLTVYVNFGSTMRPDIKISNFFYLMNQQHQIGLSYMTFHDYEIMTTLPKNAENNSKHLTRDSSCLESIECIKNM